MTPRGRVAEGARFIARTFSALSEPRARGQQWAGEKDLGAAGTGAAASILRATGTSRAELSGDAAGRCRRRVKLIRDDFSFRGSEARARLGCTRAAGFEWTRMRDRRRAARSIRVPRGWPRRAGAEGYRFIDLLCSIVIPPRFDEVDHFRHGLCRAAAGDTLGYIGRDGGWIWRQRLKGYHRRSSGWLVETNPPRGCVLRREPDAG